MGTNKANNLKSGEDLETRLIKMNIDPELKIYALSMNQLEGHLWELIGEKVKEAICLIDGYMRFTDERLRTGTKSIFCYMAGNACSYPNIMRVYRAS